MLRKKIDSNWTLTVLGENVFGIPEEPIAMKVPGSVFSTLLEAGKMPDPFYRDNELNAEKLMENDFVCETSFRLSPAEQQADRVILRFNGLDTLADVYLNGRLIGSADNMNRTWDFDITGDVRGEASDSSEAEAGEASPAGFVGSVAGEADSGKSAAGDVDFDLKVVLHSPLRYIREEQAKCYTGGSEECTEGFPHIRKAACMFGWDWGPRLADAGIFRDVEVLAVHEARLEQVYIGQKHIAAEKAPAGPLDDRKTAQVVLTAAAQPKWVSASAGAVRMQFALTSPDGSCTWTAESPALDAGTAAEQMLLDESRGDRLTAQITVENPELWWPNGYGRQPLYHALVRLVDAASGQELDTWSGEIGLRTVTVNTDLIPDEKWDPHLQEQEVKDRKEGRNFAFTVNGVPIFAMGADYIPEDNLITRVTPERTAKLIQAARVSHMNCIRIWGGGYFLDDYFYDQCDRAGLLVWQDMLFACASYELNDAFEQNITAEIRDNVRRLRHHACIGLWCGNNELETQTEYNSWHPSEKQRYDYIKMYEYIFPKLISEEDPGAFYWPSSPSSGGNFEDSNEENMGDAHYWGVWHGNEPFTAYRHHHYRFLSEFGFQSFPCMATVCSFTEPGDRNVFSRIMEMHQRSTSGNGKMMNYMSQTYQMPKNFDELIYCSQLLQADAIRYGVEHFRRFRGTSMGTVVWQLNDIWPVASWASMDYFYRWKALQYAEKRFFAPVLISCEERGLPDQMPYPNMQPRPVEFSALLHVANETPCEVSGTVEWQLADDASSVLKEGSARVTVPAFGGTWLEKLDFTDLPGFDPLRHHLTYVFRMAPADVRAVEAVTGTPLCQRVADAQGFAGEAAVQNVRSAEAAALADMPKKMTEHGGCTAAETVSGAAGDIVVSRGCSMFAAPKHYEFRDPELAISVHTAGEGESVSTVTVQADAFAKSVAVESPDGDLLLDDNYFDMEKGTAVLTIVGRDGKPLPPDQIPAGPYRARSVYGTICS